MESNEVNSSFFPPPPPRHKLFTNENITLAKRLKEQEDYGEISKHAPFDQSKQTAIVGQEVEHDLRTLVQPPQLDWIRENQGWVCFGDQEGWPDAGPRASLEGMPKLYSPTMERKDALQALLNTLIHAYMELLDVLANQGPVSLNTVGLPTTTTVAASKTDHIVSHIELAAFNMHGLCNDLRPRQARESLKLILRLQAQEKRRNAKRIRHTCDLLRAQLVALKTDCLVLAKHPSDPLVVPTAPEEPQSLAPSRPIGGYDYALLAADIQAQLATSHPSLPS